MTEPTPELKPCPFCGGSATLGGLVPWAECSSCEASGSSCTDEASAAAAWNRRPPPPPALPSIAAKLENLEFVARGRGSLACDHLAGRIAEIRRELALVEAAMRPPADLNEPSGNSGQLPAAVDPDDFDCPHSALDGCDCYAAQKGGRSDAN